MVIAAVSWLQPPNLHLRPSHTCLARVRLPWLSCIYNICADIDDYIQVERGEDEGATFPPFFPLSFFFLFLFSSPLSPPFRGDLKVFHQHSKSPLVRLLQTRLGGKTHLCGRGGLIENDEEHSGNNDFLPTTTVDSGVSI